MATTPIFCTPIVITDSNKWVDLKDNGGAEESYSIATGTYADIWALLTALDAAVGAGVAGFVSEFYGALTGDDSRLVFNAADNVQFLWATGTHTAASLATVLGFTAEDTANGAPIATSPPPNVWCPLKPPRRDTRDQPESVGGDFRRSLDGTVGKRLEVATVSSRRFEFGLLSKELIWAADATGTSRNKDLETFWGEVVAGQSLRYYPDIGSSSGVLTYYYSGSAKWRDVVQRIRDDVERYDVILELAKDMG